MKNPSSLKVITRFLLIPQLLCLSCLCSAQVKKEGSPEKNLPANIVQLTGFGERAAWSPDGRRIAFMSKSFKDAFEIDLNTRLTRLLTGHFTNEGFLRIQYLLNGDFFLIGAKKFTDIRTTRSFKQFAGRVVLEANLQRIPANSLTPTKQMASANA